MVAVREAREVLSNDAVRSQPGSFNESQGRWRFLARRRECAGGLLSLTASRASIWGPSFGCTCGSRGPATNGVPRGPVSKPLPQRDAPTKGFESCLSFHLTVLRQRGGRRSMLPQRLQTAPPPPPPSFSIHCLWISFFSASLSECPFVEMETDNKYARSIVFVLPLVFFSSVF